jgi:hypothetical protein
MPITVIDTPPDAAKLVPLLPDQTGASYVKPKSSVPTFWAIVSAGEAVLW